MEFFLICLSVVNLHDGTGVCVERLYRPVQRKNVLYIRLQAETMSVYNAQRERNPITLVRLRNHYEMQEETPSTEMDRYPIRKWEAKYYNNSTKKWMQGHLCLTGSYVHFTAADDTDSLLVLRYQNITDVKKALSMLIFKALVIRCSSHDEHWFASLTDRDYVFCLIEHFWRNCLIPSTPPQKNNPHRTPLGQELLQLAADSQRTLGQASEMLSFQGEQLGHAATMMVNLHNDLDVAEPMIKSLDSWLGRWRIPSTDEPFQFISRSAAPVTKKFPVLFQTGTSSSTSLRPGHVQVSRDGLTILNDSHIQEEHFVTREISRIQVATPWQIVVSRVKLGEPDRTFLFISAQMSAALQTLDRFFKHKLQFEDPPLDVSTFTGPEDIQDQMVPSSGHAPHECTPGDRGEHQAVCSSQSGQSEVSEDEAAQLMEALGSMKLAALGIQAEQERQMETISELTDTVEHGNIRLESANRKMKTMI